MAISDCFTESCTTIVRKLPQFYDFVVSDLTSQCAVHLKQANDIPRLFRRTNRDVSGFSSIRISLIKRTPFPNTQIWNQ